MMKFIYRSSRYHVNIKSFLWTCVSSFSFKILLGLSSISLCCWSSSSSSRVKSTGTSPIQSKPALTRLASWSWKSWDRKPREPWEAVFSWQTSMTRCWGALRHWTSWRSVSPPTLHPLLSAQLDSFKVHLHHGKKSPLSHLCYRREWPGRGQTH